MSCLKGATQIGIGAALFVMLVFAAWPPTRALAACDVEESTAAPTRDDCRAVDARDMRLGGVPQLSGSGNSGSSGGRNPRAESDSGSCSIYDIRNLGGGGRNPYATVRPMWCRDPEVSHFDGAPGYSRTDIAMRDCGSIGGLTSSFDTRLDDPATTSVTEAYDGPGGRNWQIGLMPYVVRLNDKYYFPFLDLIFDVSGLTPACADNSYDGIELTHDAVGDFLVLEINTGVNGGVFKFRDYDQASYAGGQFYSYTTDGSQVYASAYYSSNGVNEISTLSRRDLTNGTSSTPVEKIHFGGFGSSGRHSYAYHEYKDSGGTWHPSRFVDYEYFQASDTHGDEGDLEKVEVYTAYDAPGSGDPALASSWDNKIGEERYYYNAAGQVEHILDADAVAKANAASVNLDSPAAGELDTYASRAYTYHDGDTVPGGGLEDPWMAGMVASVAGEGCGGCGTSGSSIEVDWAENANQTDANLHWWRRSTQSFKDENGDVYRRETTYVNRVGQVMASIMENHSATQGAGGVLERARITLYRYNSDGQLVEVVTPSAIDSFPTKGNGEVDIAAIESDDDEDLEGVGAITVHANEGIVRVTQFYIDANTNGFDDNDTGVAIVSADGDIGGVVGYVHRSGIKNGDTGSIVWLNKTTYEQQNAGGLDGKSYPIAEQIRFVDGTTNRAVTRFVYTWHGSGGEIETIKQYDFVNENEDDPAADDALVTELVLSEEGDPLWRKAPNGVIVYNLYGDVGEQIGQIVDPDTSLTGAGQVFNGVTIPGGFANVGGLHLVSENTLDDNGRVVKTMGPETLVDADGDGDMDDTVRPVSWTVYNDGGYIGGEWKDDEVRSARGYYNTAGAGSYHLVGGISVRITEREGAAPGGGEDFGWREVTSYVTERDPAESGELADDENITTQSRWSGLSVSRFKADDLLERRSYYDIAGDDYYLTTYAYHLDGTTQYMQGPDGLRSYTFRDKKTVGGETLYETRRYSVYEDAGSKWQLAGPVSVGWSDEDGRSVRGFTASVSGALAGESADHPTGTDTLVELSRSATTHDFRGRTLERWGYFDLGTLTESQDGTEGTNYVVSEVLAYDDQSRTLRSQAPSGDISAVVYDALGRTVETWVGTNAAGATRTDPGAGASDLVLVAQAFYDSNGATAGGTPTTTLTEAQRLKPNLTAALTGAASEFTGVTYVYDDLGRRTHTKPDIGPWSNVTYTDAGQVTTAVTYKNAGSPTTNADLLTQSGSVYDGAGRMLESRVYEVDGVAAPSKYLASTVAYDDLGRQALSFNAQGAGTLTQWDDAGRTVRQILFSDNGGDDTTVTNDIVVTETVVDYIAAGASGAAVVGAGRPYLRTSYQRNHDTNAATTGLLSAMASDKSQRTFNATWYDEAGRATHSAYYGHNGHAALTDYDLGVAGTQTYDDGPPAPDTSDDMIVTETVYDDATRVDQVTANDGVVTKFFYNDAGQRTHVVENYDAAKLTGGNPDTPASRNADVNRITAFVYNHELGAVIQQVAIDPDHDGNTSDNQSTRYVYSDELTDNGTGGAGRLQSNSILRAVIYPDSDDTVTSSALADGTDATHDRVELTYYSNGTLKAREDQNGTVLTSIYHNDGALQYQDAAPGTGIDTAIKSMGYAYDDLRRVTTVTQYDDVSTGSPTAINEVVNTYTDLGQLDEQFQEHDGVKDGSTLSIGYLYDLTSVANVYTRNARFRGLTYADGRLVHTRYSSSTSISYLLDVPAEIYEDNATTPGTLGDRLVRNTYFGTSGLAEVRYTKPANDIALTHHYGDSDGDYEGYDRFYRPRNMRWWQSVAGSRAWIETGHDRGSRRVYYEDVHAAASSQDLDQLDARNAFGELTNWQLGGLDAGKDDIPTGDRDATQDWTLDQLGNWADFNHDTNGDEDFTDAADLDQSRTNNDVNEITDITEVGGQTAWATPVYDKSGNMIEIPQPSAPGSSYDATYDAWGRLVKLEDGANTVAEYVYDGLGRRIIKHVYDGGTFDYSDHAYYNGWQNIEVRRDTDSAKGGTPDADPMEQFVYHTYYIDAVAVRYWDDPDDAGGIDGTQALQYYTHDAQFNVIALMDDTGGILERYRYAPYGEQTVMDASYSTKSGGTDYGQYKGFTGQTLDPESGLWYFRARYYHAGVGTFTSADPLGYPDGMNRFAGYFAFHAENDPFGEAEVRAPIQGSFNTADDIGFQISYPGRIKIFLGMDYSIKYRWRLRRHRNDASYGHDKIQILQRIGLALDIYDLNGNKVSGFGVSLTDANEFGIMTEGPDAGYYRFFDHIQNIDAYVKVFNKILSKLEMPQECFRAVASGYYYMRVYRPSALTVRRRAIDVRNGETMTLDTLYNNETDGGGMFMKDLWITRGGQRDDELTRWANVGQESSAIVGIDAGANRPIFEFRHFDKVEVDFSTNAMSASIRWEMDSTNFDYQSFGIAEPAIDISGSNFEWEGGLRD